MFSALRNMILLALALNSGISLGVPTGVETTVAGPVDHQLAKRATVTCVSDPSHATFLSDAYIEGKLLASNAADYVNANGTTDSLYVAYFGTGAQAAVLNVLNRIANENSGIFTETCSGDADPSGLCGAGGHTIAYSKTRWYSGTTHVTSGKTYYCPQFFGEPPLADFCANPGGGTRASTVVHEMSHTTALTNDHGVGDCTEAQAKAVSDPATAVDTATNYGCFTRAVYFATKC